MPIINLVYEGHYEWKPGANTLLYRPLTSDANDTSGNNRNGTAGSVSFTNGYAELASGGYIQFPAFTVPTTFTVNMWIQIGNYDCRMYSDRDGPTRNVVYNQVSSTKIQVMIGNGGTGQGYTQIDNNMSTNTWYNLIIVKEGANVKVYNNGQYKSERTGSWSITGGTAGRNFCLGNVPGESSTFKYKDFIMENKARTAQEVLDYYNLTKGNYGL